MDIPDIISDIQSITNDTTLFDENNFDSRINAIDFIEFHIIDRIGGLLQNGEAVEELKSLKHQAESLKLQLEQVNGKLFRRLREMVRAGSLRGSSFLGMISKYVQLNANSDAKPGYDNLDIFINSLLTDQAIPEPINELEPNMVFYQKTPARVIFELTEMAQLTSSDVFCDIGSGLGQVPVLVNLLSGAATRGIEFEPAYHHYAVVCAARLNLTYVGFINADARKVDYADDTIFFMYTPFQGQMLQDVLELLKKESRRHTVRIYTYGPCSLHVANQDWLKCTNGQGDDIYKLYEFISYQSA